MTVEFAGWGDGAHAAENAALLQSMVNGLSPGTKIEFRDPPVAYAFAGTVFVDRPMALVGSGPGTVLRQAAPGADLIRVRTAEACVFEDMSVEPAPGLPLTGGAAVRVEPAGPANTGTEFHSFTSRMPEGIALPNAAYWTLAHVRLTDCRWRSLYLANANFGGDEGDNTLDDVRFHTTHPECCHLEWHSGGGLKLMACKFLGGGEAIRVMPDAGVQTAMLMLSATSIEQFAQAAIHVYDTPGRFGELVLGAGTQIGCYRPGSNGVIVDNPRFAGLSVGETIVTMSGEGGFQGGFVLLQGQLARFSRSTLIKAWQPGGTRGVVVAPGFTDRGELGDLGYLGLHQNVMVL